MYKKPSKTKEPENLDKAYEYAVFLLSLKLRTIGEVLKKMQDRGYTEAAIEETVERLKDQRYLDDQKYAEIFLENLKTYRTLGYFGIKKKFMEKRLPPQLIEEILQQGLSIKEETEIAKRFLKKLDPRGVILRSISDEESHKGDPSPLGKREAQDDAEVEDLQYRTFDEESSKQKQKLAAKLKSRGFRGEVISKLLF